MSMTDTRENLASAAPARTIVGLLAETPVHTGIGQVTGAIDLPVAREKTTNYPVLPASGWKGALRDKARQVHGGFNGPDPKIVNDLFGPETVKGDETDSAGAVQVGDGKILLLPLRSLQEVFFWATCPFVLNRLKRDLKMAGAAFTAPIPGNGSLIDQGNYKALLAAGGDRLHLEEFVFTPQIDPSGIGALAQSLLSFFPPGVTDLDELCSRLIVIPNEAFGFFCLHALPARQRNAMDKKTKTVHNGHLWSEETLAPDTLFYALWSERFASEQSAMEELRKLFEASPYIQIGGKESIGCGWLNVQFVACSALLGNEAEQ